MGQRPLLMFDPLARGQVGTHPFGSVGLRTSFRSVKSAYDTLIDWYRGVVVADASSSTASVMSG